ncbi:RagB/SusD family nutrient uptake outer membrane protein [Muricauda brasiliensis]|uniref:RagB/SusD family nutrient uptake outer membrane protein n=1 Tax=Muricauda brasiliensis TaxID=2162892 RepID=UPI000D344746|nr:RagB/SusD family nutrient uptake outer membrane protein [Muricauda brasiliensis]
MKLSSIYKFLALILFLSVQSCIKSALDTEIPSSITTGNFPRSEGDLRAILTGLYDGVRDEYNRTQYGEDRGDAFDVGLIGTVSDSWAHNLSGANGPNWRVNYNLINNANIVINTADEIEFNSSQTRGQILGEAYFIRAFVYFQMLKIWGDVPLILEPVDQTTPSVGRTAATQVMDQILLDLESALAAFPSNGFGDSKYTASAPAANALLADASLWKGKVLGGGNEDFIRAVDAINDIEGVGLLNSFGDVFDVKENNEVVFSIFFDFNEQAGMYASTITSRDVNVDRELNPNVPTSTSFNARHNYRPSDKIIALYNNPNDQRTARSFIPILTQDGSDADSDPDVLSISQNKFKGTDNNNDTFYDNDIIVYRWGGLLLLRAEALAAQGLTVEAIIDINTVRERAGTGAYTGPTDQPTVEREILDERGRELFLELKRYWDLVRFDAGSTIDIYAEVPNLAGKNLPLVWPVNDNVIAQNELIEQTEGYRN